MQGDKKYISGNPGNLKWLRFVFLVTLVVLLALEPFIHKHPYFYWEKWFGFYAIYGFLACLVLIFVSKYVFRPLLKRDVNYYD
jgi:hypothetical protein